MTCDLLTLFIPLPPPKSFPPPFFFLILLYMFSVGLHEPGLEPGPSQGSQLYCDLHLTEDTQVSKISRGLDITSTATDQHSKTLQRNINTFCF